eukprot:5730658-Amphidinium_carterae.1
MPILTWNGRVTLRSEYFDLESFTVPEPTKLGCPIQLGVEGSQLDKLSLKGHSNLGSRTVPELI